MFPFSACVKAGDKQGRRQQYQVMPASIVLAPSVRMIALLYRGEASPMRLL